MKFFIHRPILLTLLITLVIASIALLCSHQPFLGDDWGLLSLAFTHPQFGLDSIPTFSRMPVSALLGTLLIKWGAWEQAPRLFMFLFFGVHALAWTLLFKTLLERCNKQVPLHTLCFALCSVLFIFYPNNYEIHLWHFETVHAMGALLIACAFRIKSTLLRIVWIVPGLMFYDTFIFLVFGFTGLYVLAGHLHSNQKPTLRSLWNEGKPWILTLTVSSTLWIGSKILLGKLTGSIHIPPVEMNFWKTVDHIKVVLRMLWLIHFYKANWIFTGIEWLSLGGLYFITFKRKLVPNWSLFLLIIFPTLVALPLCLNTYPAPRAYYGPQILQTLVFALFLYKVLCDAFLGTHSQPKIQSTWLAPVLALSLMYAAQWIYILHIKDHNYWILDKQEQQIKEQIAHCTEPCHLIFPEPTVGLQKDYVLPTLVWTSYYTRIWMKYYPNKKVSFEIQSKVPQS